MDATLRPVIRGLHPAAWWTKLSRGRRRLILALLLVVAGLTALRIAAPYIIRGVINHLLARPGPYQGEVADVSLALWRGSYEVRRLHLTVQRPGSPTREPLFDVEAIRIGLGWRPLLRGHFVGRMDIIGPQLHLVPEPGEKTPRYPRRPPDTSGDERSDIEEEVNFTEPRPEHWQDKITGLSRFRIDELRITNGLVEYTDLARGFTARLGGIDGAVLGLRLGASEHEGKAAFRFSGTTIGHGRLVVEGRIEPLATQPSFTVRASLEDVILPELNDVTRHFEHLTFAAGRFSGYLEAKADRGRIDGFFKPIFRNLDVATYRDKKGSGAARLFWKAVVPVAEFVLENDDKNQHAARIPIEGRIDNPKTDTWSMIGSALRNAFVKALLPGFGKD